MFSRWLVAAKRRAIGTRARQKGVYDLLSLGIGASIAIAFAAAQLWQQRQALLSQQMAAQGGVVADIGNSINSKYLSLYYSNLVNGTAIPGVANEYAPTMSELQALNIVPAEFATTAVNGAPYIVSLAKTPAGCVAPNCDINGLVYIGSALTDPSTGRPLLLEDGAAAIGGDGGYSDTVTPGTVSGMNGQWTMPNPAGNVAGILAMRVGYGSSGWSAFVRRDGTLPMEGDLNFKGTNSVLHNINNAASVNAQQVVVPSGNNLKVGSAAFYGDTVNAAVRSAAGGGVYAQDVNGNYTQFNAGNVVANGNATATGNVISGGIVRTGRIATPNTACSTNGDLAQNVDGSGLALSCLFGVWKPIGGNLQRAGFYTAQHGTGIPAPTCALGGTKMIVITPNNFSVDSTTVVNYGAWGSGPWTVYIVDGVGSGIAGATATVGTYCGY